LIKNKSVSARRGENEQNLSLNSGRKRMDQKLAEKVSARSEDVKINRGEQLLKEIQEYAIKNNDDWMPQAKNQM
jgi:hypothetical protein